MMPSYEKFAQFYDQLTGNIDYPARAAYFSELIRRHHGESKLLLDLGCGTGSLSVELSRLGYEVIGVDRSADMLSVAVRKNAGLPTPVLYLCQDMRRLDLYGTIDVAVSALDSLNHLASPKDLLTAMKRVSLFTEPGGIFLFDVNTPYKHREILGNNTFVYDLEEVYCVWQNSYHPDGCRVEIQLDFFERAGDCYYRSGESFSERAYSREELEQMLREAGFGLLAVYGDDGFGEPAETTQRAVYVAEKLQ